jgi:hypothetical protein
MRAQRVPLKRLLPPVLPRPEPESSARLLPPEQCYQPQERLLRSYQESRFWPTLILDGSVILLADASSLRLT